MANLSPSPKLQFFTANGVPLSGGKLYSYAAGTTTPLATYTNQGGGTANTNPIILNSRGEAEVWLGSTNYKLKLTDSTDVEIWTVDNVSTWASVASLAASGGAALIGAAASTYNSGTTVQAQLTNVGSATGATNVGFTQTGTGADARTVSSKLKDILSVKDFGAVGDGTTDDTLAIKDAIAAAVAAAPATLTFPTGTYKCTNTLGDYFGSDVTLDGQGSTLDFSTAATSPATTFLSFSGTIATGVSLSSDAASAQKTVSVASATFAVGDFVKIKSNTVWDPGRTSSTYGELNFIQSIPSAAAVAVTNDLMSTYTTAASATIAKITPVRNINIRNIKLQGPSGNDSHKGIVITNGINCTIDGIQSYDMDNVHVQIYDSTFCRVLNSYFQESNSSSTGYGTSFANATQDCSAENNVYTDVRHSLSTNNNSAGGITRRILFANNIVTDSAPATSGSGGDAIDTHAGAEDISIIGNIVNASSGSGINVECRSATICNNVISFTQLNGITFQNYTDLTGWANVSNNTVRNVLGNYCIVVVPYTASFGTCVINGNDVDLTTTSGIRARPPTTFQFVNLTVNGNSVRMTGTSTLGGIDVEGALSGTICGNSVEAPSVGIIAQSSNNLSITGNSVRLVSDSGGATGYGVRLATSYGCVVNGNTLYDDSTLTASNAASFAATVTYSGMFGNIGSKFTAGTVFSISTGTGNVADNNIIGL